MTAPMDLDPSTDQGRQWLAEELAKSEYHDTRSLFQRLMQWLLDRLADLQSSQGGGGVSLPPFVITLVVVVLVVGVLYLVTKIRVESKTVASRATLLGDSVLTAERLRREAERAFAQERYGEAVIAWTRALARDAELRTLLPDAPSMTAHEVGAVLAPVFPRHAERIASAMDLFDGVAYGGRAASRADAELTRDLDGTLHTSRPALPARRDQEASPSAYQPPSRDQTAGSDDGSVWLTGVGQ